MIWIGTTHGVARYDGYETIVFKSDPLHPDLLTDNSITLITDTEHRVFIGTQNGLNLFDKQTAVMDCHGTSLVPMRRTIAYPSTI